MSQGQFLPISTSSPPLCGRTPRGLGVCFHFCFHTPMRLLRGCCLCLESSLSASALLQLPPTWAALLSICTPRLSFCRHLGRAVTALCYRQLSASLPGVWAPEGRDQINFYFSVRNPSFQHSTCPHSQCLVNGCRINKQRTAFSRGYRKRKMSERANSIFTKKEIADIMWNHVYLIVNQEPWKQFSPR